MKGDAVPSDAPVRFEVAVDAGKEARLNTTEGKSLMFTCAPGSQAMLVNMVEELATYTGPVR
jgi:hypothetical protein